MSNWQARQKTLNPLGKFSWKTLIWENQHHSSTRISAGAKEKLPTRASGKPDAGTISSWSCVMEGHAKKCVERYCEFAHKTAQHVFKVATPCMDDHQLKEEENESVGELSTVCSQIVLKCLYLARIGRPDILLSVNKFARALTKWTKACYKLLTRLISYIHHTSECRQYCYVETQHNSAE